MNDFFDKLGAAAHRIADNVSTEVSIAAQQQKVREAYIALGKLYYQSTQAGYQPQGPAFDEQVRRATGALARIRQLREAKQVEPETDFVDI